MGWKNRGSGFDSRQGQEITDFSTACRHVGVKRPDLEADHQLLSSAEVKNMWNYTSTSSYMLVVWIN
jgi:hypothetical protein